MSLVTLERTAEYLTSVGLDTSYARAFDDPGDMLDMVSRLHDEERRKRREQVIAECGNASVAHFSSPDGKWHLYAHQSTYPAYLGKWQLSRVDDRGPVGHCNHDTFEEAVAACVGCADNSYWNEGKLNYRLVETSGNRA